MGYYMDQNESFFCIKNENVNKAWEAIEKLVLENNIAWVYSQDVINAKSFDEAIGECGWDVYRDDLTNDIFDISFAGEKLGDDFLIFKAIAPYVEENSYIQMSGEDGCIWRWVFKNGTVIEEEAVITFES